MSDAIYCEKHETPNVKVTWNEYETYLCPICVREKLGMSQTWRNE